MCVYSDIYAANRFIAEKNLAWRIRMYIHLCACTRKVFFFFLFFFLRAHIFVDSVSPLRRFSALLRPLVSFSDCIFIALSIDPLLSAISRPLAAVQKRFITRWHLDGETPVGHRGLNKRFRNLTIFIRDLSPPPSSPSITPPPFPVFLRFWRNRALFDSSPVTF